MEEAKPERRQALTDTVLMIRPKYFGYNRETARSNLFMNKRTADGLSMLEAHAKGLEEFEGFVKTLRENGVTVHVEDDQTGHTHGSTAGCEDAVFPNNWLSFHQCGKMVLYPMEAKSRRKERVSEIVERWSKKLSSSVVDYTPYENKELFLEGTGSLVLDRVNCVAYASLSSRTSKVMVLRFCEDFEYKPVIFRAYQRVQTASGTTSASDGDAYKPIYHTNVMLSVGKSFAVACLDSVRDEEERERLVESLLQSKKTIVPISEDQMDHFAGNCLHLSSSTDANKSVIAMSTRAYQSLNASQVKELLQHCDGFAHTPLYTIEDLGGGSARCMLAEVFS
jgi:hypothetical protein